MLLYTLFLIGISVEAITGAIAAGRKKMDFFGVVIIACITGLGGGTIRDILFNNYPLVWVLHPFYLLVTASAATATIILAPSFLRILKVFLILDALGLAAFVIIGTDKALALQLPFSVCVISGMLTGISGGMLRDILCNDIPLVLRREIYALIAVFGAIFYMVLTLHTHLPHLAVIILSLAAMFGFRVLAIIYHIEMPKFDYRKHLRS